ncbi:MAG: hypothetical protein HYT77_04910 [Deltaproteobacteria bacterium]|nr:hypothetical protein [Deltaproteobacteria bacterium]
MRLSARTALLLIPLLFVVSGCGGRTPSPETSQRVIAKTFKKYGKKYNETDFGKYAIDRVEVAHTEELQSKLASVETFIYLNEGPVYRVRSTLVKKAFGWRHRSWENLGKR